MTSTHSLKSGFAPFMPRARLLRLIGSELISDDVVAITELVKNAHDADATFVSIQFVGVTGSDGEIIIRDDGHGMDLDTLLSRWMQPAGSSKGREGTRFTQAGRRVLGEKGVGRFAADKLAATLELASRKRAETSELHAVFDWDEFDADDRMLADIKSSWDVRAADWLDSHGTMLRLGRLRSVWTERMFRRLCTRLARLVSPFVTRKDFRILIESDEFPQYSGEVGGGYLDVAPYQVEAEFDGKSAFTLKLNGTKSPRQTLAAEQRPSCGPLRLRLFAFDLETEALAKLGPRAEVRAWLREWSGISVYRDSFRVWPYGESHDDWLRLDQRRVNNPVVRLSNNQIVGFVEISSDRNPELRDQTNREGLIHNDAFEDLQKFVLFVMNLLEAERQAHRHPQSKRAAVSPTAHRKTREAAALPDQLEALAAKATGPIGDELRRAAQRARSAAASDLAARKKMLEGYTELAAAGQTASLVGQSISTCLETVRAVCKTLHGSLGRDSLDEVVKANSALVRLQASAAIAEEHLRAMTSMQSGASRRRRGLDVADELKRLQDLSRPLLQEHDAEMAVEAGDDLVTRTEMRPEMFGAVISALVMNSVGWKAAERRLRITTGARVDGDFIEILVSDNGKGVTPGLEGSIFEPMVSGQPDAAGMGLTIARSVVEMHGGTISLVPDRRRKGATFRVSLPRKKARSTSRL